MPKDAAGTHPKPTQGTSEMAEACEGLQRHPKGRECVETLLFTTLLKGLTEYQRVQEASQNLPQNQLNLKRITARPPIDI